MKKLNSSLILLSMVFAFLVSFVSCSEKVPEDPVIPDVILAEDSVGVDCISFTLIPRNTDRCAYLCYKKDGAALPNAEQIFSEGIALQKIKVQKIEINGLEADTEYVVVAAAGTGETVVSEPLYMTTSKIDNPEEPENPEDPEDPVSHMDVAIKDVSVTYDSITFTIVPMDAGAVAYDYYLKTDNFQMPDAWDIFSKGIRLESAANPQTITIDGLRDNSAYYVFVAVESPSSYDRIMKYVEVITAERPGPEDLPKAYFTEGELSVFNGRNYVVKMENDEYAVELDMYGSDVPDYALHMESGEYVFQTEYHGGAAWVMDSRTKVHLKQGETDLQLVKGSVTVVYENGSYRMTGRLISADNKAFNMEFSGELDYPYCPVEGRIDLVDGKYSLLVSSTYHAVKVDFSGTEIIGHHTLGTGLASINIQVIDNEVKNWNAESADIEISRPYEDAIQISGLLLLENGERVIVQSGTISILEPEKPDTEEIVFTRNTAFGGPDMTGWQSAYALTLENDEWMFYFEFDCPGSYDQLPTGKLTYVSWGGGEIGAYRITRNGSEYKDIDQGFIDVSKDGSTYTIRVEMTRDGGEALKGVYTGPVDCIDMSGSDY